MEYEEDHLDQVRHAFLGQVTYIQAAAKWFEMMALYANTGGEA